MDLDIPGQIVIAGTAATVSVVRRGVGRPVRDRGGSQGLSRSSNTS